MKEGDLVKCIWEEIGIVLWQVGDTDRYMVHWSSWREEDRVLGIVTRIYEHQNRPCCDIFFADGFTGELIWLWELEVISESR